jgi:CheY-like chemotaxis protein
MSLNPNSAKMFVQSDDQTLMRRGFIADGPRVLVVEDHEDTRVMLRMILERRGCRVYEAADGLEAVETAARERPRLILMDGSLPRLDGLEATRRIRESAPLQEMLIVALNGWGTPGFHTAALAAGCNDCLSKPIDFGRLKNLLDNLF